MIIKFLQHCTTVGSTTRGGIGLLLKTERSQLGSIVHGQERMFANETSNHNSQLCLMKTLSIFQFMYMAGTDRTV